MEATHIATGYEGVPAPSRKQQYRQQQVWKLRTQITHFEEVLKVARAQEQATVVCWISGQLEAYRMQLAAEEKKLAKFF